MLNNFGAENNFKLPGHLNRIFFGHTHVQGGYIYGHGKARAFAPKYESKDEPAQVTLTLTAGERYLINPGSVGQPRDGDWRAAFALYEDSPEQVTFYRVPYPLQQAQVRIRTAGLPERLAARLGQGR